MSSPDNLYCPKNSKHRRFRCGAIQYHDWIVDEHGEFLEDEGCYDAEASEYIDNYTCAECGTQAKSRE